MIKRSKNKDNRRDFDDVMNGVEQEVQAFCPKWAVRQTSAC